MNILIDSSSNIITILPPKQIFEHQNVQSSETLNFQPLNLINLLHYNPSLHASIKLFSNLEL